MEESPVLVLAERLRSWRRGPYPQSTSFVSAVSSSMDGECRWISDVHNIMDIEAAIEAVLTYRQQEVLYRFVVRGEEQRQIAGIIGISQQAVSIELETALKALEKY